MNKEDLNFIAGIVLGILITLFIVMYLGWRPTLESIQEVFRQDFYLETET